ncbi:hypothetical protein [Leptolyngbya sp. ST-U4]|uniref:hypothetical protein n=1 Tax=Leptolyngbya sp. ST-U4 TaxID=2933912 RepID=UPI00329881C3
MSLGKVANLIMAGNVRVRWKEVTQASHHLKPSRLVAILGEGRLEVGEVVICVCL